MEVAREQPYTGSGFLVSIGDQDGREAAAGFAGVVFPPFKSRQEHPAEGGADGARLVLRRGVTGRLDLYQWWDAARRHKKPPMRTVTVQLLADDQRTVVITWRFLDAYPVTLSYSPLNAMEGGVLMEEVALAFGRVEME